MKLQTALRVGQDPCPPGDYQQTCKNVSCQVETDYKTGNPVRVNVNALCPSPTDSDNWILNMQVFPYGVMERSLVICDGLLKIPPC